MKTYSKILTQAAVAAIIGAGAMAATVAPASADIACNRRGDCWHVQGHVDYRPEFGVSIHPDNWHWGRRDHFRFREHEGRGYWRNGLWVTF